MPALHSVLFHFTHQMTSGYSISLIRDPARGTSQFYLRVAWTFAFKQFFLILHLGFLWCHLITEVALFPPRAPFAPISPFLSSKANQYRTGKTRLKKERTHELDTKSYPRNKLCNMIRETGIWNVITSQLQVRMSRKE